jgi:hypothetical protein
MVGRMRGSGQACHGSRACPIWAGGTEDCVRTVLEPSAAIGHQKTQLRERGAAKDLNGSQCCPMASDSPRDFGNLKSRARCRARCMETPPRWSQVLWVRAGGKKPGSDSGQREPGGILQPASSCFARQGVLAVLAGI